MGFFSEIASEARRGIATPTLQTAAPPAAPNPRANAPVTVPEPPATQSIPTPLAPNPPAAPLAKTPPAPSAPAPEVKLTVEQNTAQDIDDTAARQAHEAAEAKRKAGWDAKQAEKKAARQEQLDRLAAMSDEDASADAIKRIGADTERLTRRNMKEAVCEHIQALCRQDAAFARRTMAPEKSMINCFQYINRKAREYAEQEMKDNGIERRGVYGLDVPDDLCYQWAEDYFNDPNAKEDRKDDEKFVPKPYVPANRKKTQSKADKKPSGAAKSKAGKPPEGVCIEQLTLGVI